MAVFLRAPLILLCTLNSHKEAIGCSVFQTYWIVGPFLFFFFKAHLLTPPRVSVCEAQFRKHCPPTNHVFCLWDSVHCASSSPSSSPIFEILPTFRAHLKGRLYLEAFPDFLNVASCPGNLMVHSLCVFPSISHIFVSFPVDSLLICPVG